MQVLSPREPLQLIILPIVAALILARCTPTPPTEAALPFIEVSSSASDARSLVVMLPGRGDRADTFFREGFQNAGEQYGFDTILVDAHFGYYRERSLIPRLDEDIIQPAREAGYEHIWLLGVSMGGFGSVLYAANHPEEVDGIILLAPFLGEPDVIEEINEAGGLGQWSPANSSLKDYEIEMWSWLQASTDDNARQSVILGYGLSDRLAESYPILVDRLDPSRVYTLEGGHAWSTWRPLWEKIASEVDW